MYSPPPRAPPLDPAPAPASVSVLVIAQRATLAGGVDETCRGAMSVPISSRMPDMTRWGQLVDLWEELYCLTEVIGVGDRRRRAAGSELGGTAAAPAVVVENVVGKVGVAGLRCDSGRTDCIALDLAAAAVAAAPAYTDADTDQLPLQLSSSQCWKYSRTVASCR
jgi:hypothetical protein